MKTSMANGDKIDFCRHVTKYKQKPIDGCNRQTEVETDRYINE